MSRSGCSYSCDQWQGIRWRGAVTSALRGRRGQAFLREMLAALDALPEQRLVKNALEASGAVCALGAVGRARGLDMSALDPEDHCTVADKFDVAHAMVCEIMWANDEGAGYWREETPEQRWTRMRAWVVRKIK